MGGPAHQDTWAAVQPWLCSSMWQLAPGVLHHTEALD